MTSGDEWFNETNVVKEEGENEESLLVDVESHEDLPNMKQETDDLGFSNQTHITTPVKSRTSPELREWLKHFRSQILAPIFRNAKSTPFRKPVDAVALGIYPVYFQIIKKPMDLGTIRQNMDNGVYVTKDEAIADLMLVWDNAMTFNLPDHFIHQTAAELKEQCQTRLDKLEREGFPPPPAPKPITMTQPKRDSLIRRDARKKSFDLPGEVSTPQHLEQKYVSKLSSSLKACDSILKNLLSLKLHRDYVEPFLHVDRKTESDAYQPMSLSKVQQRMRGLHYSHPMEFADDMRRIVTETYRYCHPDDPIVTAAAKLQQEFEMLFAKINFQENELVPPILAAGSSQLREDDEYISKLLSAQNFMVQIQTDLTELIRDYMRMKSKNKNKTNKKRKTATPGGARPLIPPQMMTPGFRPLMQGQLVERPSGKQSSNKPSGTGKQTAQRPAGSGGKVMPSASKRPRLDSQQHTPPAPASKPFLTLQEANELKEEIARLDSEYQFRILEILQANGEKLVPDEDGEVEIEIVSCSAKSVTEVKAFLASVKKAASIAKSTPLPPPPQQQRVVPSGGGKTLSHPPPPKSKAKSPKGGHLNKIKPEKTSRLSDSSSDDSSSSDSSSDDSSDSSSDSEEN